MLDIGKRIGISARFNYSHHIGEAFMVICVSCGGRELWQEEAFFNGDVCSSDGARRYEQFLGSLKEWAEQKKDEALDNLRAIADAMSTINPLEDES